MVDTVPSSLGLIKENGGSVDAVSDHQVMWADELSERHQLITWAKSGTSEPLMGKVFSGNVEVRATVNDARQLDLSDDVSLGGSATLTVYYL
jgi:hypothetical protein